MQPANTAIQRPGLQLPDTDHESERSDDDNDDMMCAPEKLSASRLSVRSASRFLSDMLPHRDGLGESVGGEGMGRTEEELEESEKVGNVQRAGERTRDRKKKQEGVLVGARSVWLTGSFPASQSGRDARVKTDNRGGEKRLGRVCVCHNVCVCVCVCYPLFASFQTGCITLKV
jgi:hypothetical protein